jgi:hypothetical protein
MSIYFEPALEDIDNPTLLPYDGMYQCYTDCDGDVVFHGDQADFLYELEHGRNGVECIGANWYGLLHTLQDIYETVEIVDMTSSAGDWMLVFKSDNGRWWPAWQENMYPTLGYRWSISHEWSGATIEELLAVLEAATWPAGDVWDDIPAL